MPALPEDQLIHVVTTFPDGMIHRIDISEGLFDDHEADLGLLYGHDVRRARRKWRELHGETAE